VLTGLVALGVAHLREGVVRVVDPCPALQHFSGHDAGGFSPAKLRSDAIS